MNPTDAGENRSGIFIASKGGQVNISAMNAQTFELYNVTDFREIFRG